MEGISPETSELLADVERIEREYLDLRERSSRSARTYRKDLIQLSGRQIADRIFGYEDQGDCVVNVIPGRYPGYCRSTLLVVIGSGESPNTRVLEAIKHIASDCPDKTREVVFYAFNWNFRVWYDSIDSFVKQSVKVLLRMPGQRVCVKLL